MNKRIAAALAGIAVGVTTLTSVALAGPAEEPRAPREPVDETRAVVCRMLEELNGLEGVDLDDILTDLGCDEEEPTTTTTTKTTTKSSAASGGGGGGAAVESRYKPENPNHYVPKPNDYLDIPKPNDYLDIPKPNDYLDS
ncbi:hypothetical protein [Saccharothrix xinjiangensis]|uniref:Secreted protein n=1 Tax=Saccharothrix xinjiangensis TaxID=204798 RepID=A0ABV9Y1Q3_9PSEU